MVMGPANPYNRRFRWWYESISDLMISNPELRDQEIAARLKRHPNTVCQIMQSDMFREFHAQRRAAWRERHDAAVSGKLTKLGESALDILLSQLETKRDKIPMALVHEVAMGALDRLGYAPKTTQVAIDARQQTQNVVLQGITAADLAEARRAMVIAQERGRGSSFAPEYAPVLTASTSADVEEAELILGAHSAPSPD